MLSKIPRTIAFFCAAALAAAAQAEDSYYRVRISDLKITEGELPKEPSQPQWRYWQRAQTMRPYAVLDGPGEVYVGTGDSTRGSPFWTPMPESWQRDDRVALFVRTPQEGDIPGRLYFPKSDWSGMEALKFTIPAKEAKANTREPFYRAKKRTSTASYGAICPAGPGSAMKLARRKSLCTSNRTKLPRGTHRFRQIPPTPCPADVWHRNSPSLAAAAP